MHKYYTVIMLILKIAIENAYMQGNHINVEVYTHKCRRVHVHCSYLVVSSKNLQQYNLQFVINWPMQFAGRAHEPSALMSMSLGQKQPTPSVCVGLGLVQLGGGTIPQPEVWSTGQSGKKRECVQHASNLRVQNNISFVESKLQKGCDCKVTFILHILSQRRHTLTYIIISHYQ